MKFLRIAVISLFALVFLGSSACSYAGNQVMAEQQVAIERGDLTVKVNGTGKTAYASDVRLSFGTAGKVEKLTVKKGDAVAKGAILAELDTDGLKLAFAEARTTEAQAERGLTQAKLALIQAEVGEARATQDLYSAQFALDQIKAVSDIKDKIMQIEWEIKVMEVNRSQAQATGNSSSVKTLNESIRQKNLELAEQNQKLQDLLAKDEYAGVAPYEVKSFTIGGQRYDRLVVDDVRMKQQQVLLDEKAIEQAKADIEQARLGVVQAELALEQARKQVEYIQEQLREASIIAPFDGIVADLTIKENEYISASSLEAGAPVYMVDPGSLEIETEIDEIDVAGIKLDQKAIITLDALPDRHFEGTVTAISVMPVVKPQNSGVVVYSVKVGFTGAPPAEVKPGMSATVDIISMEKKDVILVPNKSIKRNSQGRNVVNVIINEKVEERLVTLGISDGTVTEVISGLEEGELVSRSVKETNARLSGV
jgi:HlyD family secretion protein